MQMQKKRTRVESSQQKSSVAPSKLVAEAHDMLMECSRKHLGSLLAVLLKQSSVSAIEGMLSAAGKLGCFKPKSAPFQLCSHSVLNSVFSYLPEKELGGVEIVCRRWRVACKDSNAGWVSALGRREKFNEELRRNLAVRGLNPALVWTSQCLKSGRLTPEVVRAISKMSHLTDLDVGQSNAVAEAIDTCFLERLTNLKTLRTRIDLFLEDAFRAPSLTELSLIGRASARVFELVQASMSIVKLDLHADGRVSAKMFEKLPNLTHLSLALNEQPASVEELAHLASLRVLRLKHHDACRHLPQLAKLTQITALVLSDQSKPPSLAPLAALRSLRHFGFGFKSRLGCEHLKLDALAMLPLHSLQLDNVSLTKADIKTFAKLPALERLTVTRAFAWQYEWNAQLQVIQMKPPNYLLKTFLKDIRTALRNVQLYVERDVRDADVASSENVVVVNPTRELPPWPPGD